MCWITKLKPWKSFICWKAYVELQEISTWPPCVFTYWNVGHIIEGSWMGGVPLHELGTLFCN